MSNNTRVFNITRQFSLRQNQALKAIENCACEWVEVGKSIRDLSLTESIAARNKQASEREPLCSSEIPGIVYQPASTGIESHRHGFMLTREANEFYLNATTYKNGCPVLES